MHKPIGHDSYHHHGGAVTAVGIPGLSTRETGNHIANTRQDDTVGLGEQDLKAHISIYGRIDINQATPAQVEGALCILPEFRRASRYAVQRKAEEILAKRSRLGAITNMDSFWRAQGISSAYSLEQLRRFFIVPAKQQPDPRVVSLVEELRANIFANARSGLGALIKNGRVMICPEDEGYATYLFSEPEPWKVAYDSTISSLVTAHRAARDGLDVSRCRFRLPYITPTLSGERCVFVNHDMTIIRVGNKVHVVDIGPIGRLLGIAEGCAVRDGTIPTPLWVAREEIGFEHARCYVASGRNVFIFNDLAETGPEVYSQKLASGLDDFVHLGDFEINGETFFISGGLVVDSNGIPRLICSFDGPVEFDPVTQTLQAKQALTLEFRFTGMSLETFREMIRNLKVDPDQFVFWLSNNVKSFPGIELDERALPEHDSPLIEQLQHHGAVFYACIMNSFSVFGAEGSAVVAGFANAEKVRAHANGVRIEVHENEPPPWRSESREAGRLSHTACWHDSAFQNSFAGFRRDVSQFLVDPQSVPFHAVSGGRSVIFRLPQPLKLGKRKFIGMKLKGGCNVEGNAAGPILLKRYTGRGSGSSGLATYNEASMLRFSRPNNVPQGGLLLSGALTEANISDFGFKNGAPVNPASCFMQFTHPDMRFMGESLGIVGILLESLDDERVNDRLRKLATLALSDVSLAREQTIDVLTDVGQTLWEYHLSLIHGGFTTLDSFELTHSGIYVVDQDHARRRGTLTREAFVAHRMDDVNVLVLDMLASLYGGEIGGTLDSNSAQILQNLTGVNIIETVLKGYFKDLYQDPRVKLIGRGGINSILWSQGLAIFPTPIVDIKHPIVDFFKELV